MISQLTPLLSNVATSVRPQDLLLMKGAWVSFSDRFPDTHEWCSGRLFEVEEEPVIVPYSLSYILPGSDYKDINLSNASAGVKLYPEKKGVLYQIALGLKPGDYLMHVYIPDTSKYVYHLGETGMYPDITSTTKKYLGAKTPMDTPADAPLMFFYAIKDMPAINLRFLILESVDYEKVTAKLQVNKLQLKEIREPTEEQLKLSAKIPWYTEMSGF